MDVQEPPPDGGTRPLVATISLLGVLVTGLSLAAVERLDRSAPARFLAVAAVVTALTAVLVALAGQLSGAASSPKAPGRKAILLAAALSGMAVLLAGAGTLFVVLARKDSGAVSTEPAMVVQRTSTVGNMDTVTAELSFPGLKAGSVVNATMAGISVDSRYVLTRTAVRVNADAPALVRMTAPVTAGDEVVIEATSPGHSCEVRLPSGEAGGETPLRCSSR
ncbi:hypothetical protein AB0368_22265 [Actinoplanes sp. NPDC051475]|uniref:hypothetical protein n=1 Tax=Actinoplanes sp. NPDC051475 TaxID=3157225 RepID=UPI0034503E2B